MREQLILRLLKAIDKELEYRGMVAETDFIYRRQLLCANEYKADYVAELLRLPGSASRRLRED